MNAQLQDYRSQVQELPECEDSWFPEALAQYRSGDDEARRRILGSCLRMALQLAEARSELDDADDLFDLIEEANCGLTQALRTFPGADAQDFLSYATETINGCLDRLRSQP